MGLRWDQVQRRHEHRFWCLGTSVMVRHTYRRVDIYVTVGWSKITGVVVGYSIRSLKRPLLLSLVVLEGFKGVQCFRGGFKVGSMNLGHRLRRRWPGADKGVNSLDTFIHHSFFCENRDRNTTKERDLTFRNPLWSSLSSNEFTAPSRPAPRLVLLNLHADSFLWGRT